MSSMRRIFLDSVVAQFEKDFARGRIIDIGGKKDNRRGKWKPSMKEGVIWKYLNIDADTSPDFQVSAEKTGLPAESFDSFIMCELLEHVRDPDAVLRESHRLLRPGGFGLITMPFLNQIHGDPNDFQRWTKEKLCSAIVDAKFEVLSANSMGGLWAVVFDLLRASAYGAVALHKKSLARKTVLKLLVASQPIWSFYDKKSEAVSSSITTGWAVVVRRS